MKHKRVELPITEPIYGTYQYLMPGCVILDDNPSIRNWYLNQAMNWSCDHRFLHGYSSPHIDLSEARWTNNPHVERYVFSTRFLKGCLHALICNLLDRGYYVYFDNVDDFYVKGKSWYHTRHFRHDGIICGYDRQTHEYCIYAYDSTWVCRKFWTPWRAFEKGGRVLAAQGVYSNLYAFKAKRGSVAFEPKTALDNMKIYLDSSLSKYPTSQNGNVYGIAVHRYLLMYLSRLLDGSICHERLDRRVFRLVWEHKRMMLERLEKLEQALALDERTSRAYRSIVEEANRIRLLYASYHIRRRDSLLPQMKKKLATIDRRERALLWHFIKKAEGAMTHDAME